MNSIKEYKVKIKKLEKENEKKDINLKRELKNRKKRY